MFRRALASSLAAVLAQQATAAWDWTPRTLDLRQEVGECAGDDAPAGLNWFAEENVFTFPSSAVSAVETSVEVANGMSIKYGLNFKIVTVGGSQEQYILTQCGTTAPTDAEMNAVEALPDGYTRKHFTIPLQKAIADTTTVLGFVDELGVADRFSSVDMYASGSCWQKYLDCGGQRESTYGGNATVRDLQTAHADGIFMGCGFGDATCSNVKDLSNGILFPSTFEPGNLHTAEYIKFVAAFFNKERVANTFFTSMLSTYTSFPAQSPRPVVAWINYKSGSYYPRSFFEISHSKYKKQLVMDAGFENVDVAALQLALTSMEQVSDNAGGFNYYLYVDQYGDQTTTEAFQAASDALFAELASVAAVIDESYEYDPAAYDINAFYTKYGLTAASSQTFITDSKVIRVDGQAGEVNTGLDWFQSRLAHPEWALEGLVRVLKADTTKTKYYFRNIATGEAVDLFSKDQCTMDLPVCSASGTTYAQAILTLQEAITEADSAQSLTIAPLLLSVLLMLRI